MLLHFAGLYRIFSTRPMFLSLLLQISCTLRISSEPLAYEGILSQAWTVLPISGMPGLSGVLIFAANIALTLAFGRQSLARNQATQQAFLQDFAD